MIVKLINRILLLSNLLLILISIASCQNNDINIEFKKAKSSFLEVYSIDSIFKHFPTEVKKSILFSGHFAPPDKGQCFGELVLGIKTTSDKLQAIKNQQFLIIDSIYSSKYLLLKYDLVADSFYNTKNQIDSSFLFPIVDLHQNDYYLGEIPDSTYDADINKYVPLPNYKIPQDLIVYLVDAQPGYFWKTKCDHYRSKKLGKWIHGYSRGYAISEKEKIIVYWVVTW